MTNNLWLNKSSSCGLKRQKYLLTATVAKQENIVVLALLGILVGSARDAQPRCTNSPSPVPCVLLASLPLG